MFQKCPKNVPNMSQKCPKMFQTCPTTLKKIPCFFKHVLKKSPNRLLSDLSVQIGAMKRDSVGRPFPGTDIISRAFVERWEPSILRKNDNDFGTTSLKCSKNITR